MAAGVLLWHSARSGVERLELVLAAALIQLRLLCNMMDGLVAVEGNMRSPTGELYNEVPDRVSDAAVLVGAGYAAASSPALGYAAAIMAILVAYVRAIGKGCGLPSDFRGPMAKQQRMFLVTIACVYLGVAPKEWRPSLPAFLDAPSSGLFVIVLAIIIIGCVLTAWRRLVGIARGLRSAGEHT